MAITKPAVLPPWAESGDVVQPTNAEIQSGWQAGSVPPSRQRFNWILKYLAQGVRYMMQMGIPVWDSTEDYPVNARVMGSDGKTYKAILTGINKDPTTQPTYWTRWGFTLAELNAEGTTPPQFDNGTSLATTEFVQRALGNLRSETAVNSSTTLDAAALGQLVVGSAGTYTTTLPLANSAPAGARIHFFGTTGIGTWVVQGQGADVIDNNGGETFFTIGTGDSAVLESNGVGTWRIVGGSVSLRNSANFGKSLAASGYQKLPSGLIIQWGVTSTVNQSAQATVTLPIAFPTTGVSLSAIPRVSTVENGAIANGDFVSNSQIKLANQSTAATPFAIWWVAIGH